MSKPSIRLSEALEELAREELPSSEPLDAELLVAYENDRLPEAEMERVRDHLVGCPRSRELLRELRSFPGAGAELSEAELEDAWDRLGARLEPRSTASPPRVLPYRWPETAPGKTPATVRWRALAAALALLAVGLGGWAVHLGRTVSELTGPRANVLIHDLYPVDDPLRQGGAETPSIDLSGDAGALVLVLHLGEGADLRPRARLLDSEGSLLWRGPELEVTPGGIATVAIPRRYLPPGGYQLVLTGASGEGPRERYFFEVGKR